MSEPKYPLISFVVPLYNEAVGLEFFHKSLVKIAKKTASETYEIIYCDDGSTDNTALIVRAWNAKDPRVKLVRFSRNFGKESALTAGITEASGQAVMMLDGDGQHPIELIPKFIDAWRNGAQVVVGVRTGNTRERWFRRVRSWLFYQVFNRFTGQKIIPGSTDFRLIDRQVQQAFLGLKESSRITRGLIDWLGFRRKFIHFKAYERKSGSPTYGRRQLIGLAINSFVSLSPIPLYLFGYLGMFITTGAFLLGSSILVEQIILNDPLRWKFTGTAMLGTLILFLVGIVLMSQGILSLYISRIHSQSKARPLYVIDYLASAGIKK